MDIAQFSPINPPHRLLMGPGPINADPRVLRAMSSQLIGQYDPAMTHYMNEVMALYRGVFRTSNRWTMLVDGTSRAGIEAILISAIRPGDKVLVPVFGRFGHLLCEIARRCRAEVHTIEVPWGEVFSPEQIEDAIKRVRPRMLLTVQGDTSTTMLQPLAELGEICRRYDVLFYTDATASSIPAQSCRRHRLYRYATGRSGYFVPIFADRWDHNRRTRAARYPGGQEETGDRRQTPRWYFCRQD